MNIPVDLRSGALIRMIIVAFAGDTDFTDAMSFIFCVSFLWAHIPPQDRR
jgi:hypothetical protein